MNNSKTFLPSVFLESHKAFRNTKNNTNAKESLKKFSATNKDQLKMFDEDADNELRNLTISRESPGQDIYDIISRNGTPQQLVSFLCATRLFQERNTRFLENISFSDFASIEPNLKKFDTKIEQRIFMRNLDLVGNIGVKVRIRKDGDKNSLLFGIETTEICDEKGVVERIIFKQFELFPNLSDKQFGALSKLRIPASMVLLAPISKDDLCIILWFYLFAQLDRNGWDSFQTSFEELFEKTGLTDAKKIRKKRAIIAYLNRIAENWLIKPLKNLEEIDYSEKIKIERWENFS